MEDNLLIYLLIGILGNDIAQYVIKNDKKLKIPFVLVYLIGFSVVYTISVLFFSVVYMIHGTELPWMEIGVFSIAVGLGIVLLLWIIATIKCFVSR